VLGIINHGSWPSFSGIAAWRSFHIGVSWRSCAERNENEQQIALQTEEANGDSGGWNYMRRSEISAECLQATLKADGVHFGVELRKASMYWSWLVYSFIRQRLYISI
jgi:hypothetical protein